MSKLIITSLVNSGLFQALNTTEQQSTTGDIKLEATLFSPKKLNMFITVIYGG